ncbi:hypothetical protein ISS30_05325 [bacterium]|nr:hypothetical protein [bacterium]
MTLIDRFSSFKYRKDEIFHSCDMPSITIKFLAYSLSITISRHPIAVAASDMSVIIDVNFIISSLLFTGSKYLGMI